MKVTIVLLEGGVTYSYDKDVVEAGPSGTFFKVVLQSDEEVTKGGLIARVNGARKHVWVPASTISRVEVVE